MRALTRFRVVPDAVVRSHSGKALTRLADFLRHPRSIGDVAWGGRPVAARRRGRERPDQRAE